MKLTHRLLLTAGLLAMAAPLAWGRAPLPPPPDYFPLKVGYWWKYQTRGTNSPAVTKYTMKVIKADKAVDGTTLYEMETKNEAVTAVPIHDWYSKPRGWVLMHKIEYPSNNQTAEYAPTPLKYLENPPGKGAKWDWTGTGMMSIDIKQENVVTGGETVTVPAGKFGCQRVDTDVTQGGAKIHKTYYYADWIGLVKGVTKGDNYEATSELVDYSFRPKH